MFAKGTIHWIGASLTLYIITFVLLIYNLLNPVAEDRIEFTLGSLFMGIAIIIFFIMTIFFIVFFRDPARIPAGSGIVAPADGVIKDIKKEAFDGKSYIRIITFMNVHNVHVNRIPLDGKIISIERKEGGYLPAYKPESSTNNLVETVLKTEIGLVKIIQITGIFARRIVVYLSEGDSAEKGDRLGMIKFGSRVDLLLPAKKVKILSKPGNKVQANKTTLAELKK